MRIFPNCGCITGNTSPCPRCGANPEPRNEVSCGEHQSPDPAHIPASGLVRQGTIGVPRRFGTFRILVALPVFAQIFWLMQWLGAPPSMFVGVTLFVLLVATAQPLLFGGSKPRQASFTAGLIAGPIAAVIMSWLARRIDGPPEVNDPLSVFLFAGFIAFLGGPFPCWWIDGRCFPPPWSGSRRPKLRFGRRRTAHPSTGRLICRAQAPPL